MTDQPTVTVLEARKNLADLLNRTAYGDARIRISRHGKPVAAIISIDDLEMLEALENRADLETVERIERESTKDDYVRWEDVRDKL